MMDLCEETLLRRKGRRMFVINQNIFGDSDADAQAFLTVTGITDSTISNAINTLVLGLKANNLLTKMLAVYPFVGGTATTHKYNLKDPRDLDAAFRLGFNGGITHSGTGALPNGSTGYANTFLNQVSQSLTNSNHFSVYYRNNTTGVRTDGAYKASAPSAWWQMSLKDTTYTFMYGSLAQPIGVSISDTRGLFTLSRQSSTNLRSFRNDGFLANTTSTKSVTNSVTVYLFARHYEGLSYGEYFNNKECAFASLGTGLDDTDVSKLYTLVQAFQTTLGRQV